MGRAANGSDRETSDRRWAEQVVDGLACAARPRLPVCFGLRGAGEHPGFHRGGQEGGSGDKAASSGGGPRSRPRRLADGSRRPGASSNASRTSSRRPAPGGGRGRAVLRGVERGSAATRPRSPDRRLGRLSTCWETTEPRRGRGLIPKQAPLRVGSTGRTSASETFAFAAISSAVAWSKPRSVKSAERRVHQVVAGLDPSCAHGDRHSQMTVYAI